MTEMTPEKLREEWHKLEHSRDIDDALQTLELAVPAWEDDRADASAVRRERDILYESQVKLEAAQDRIEALMQANAKAAILRGEDLEHIEVLEIEAAMWRALAGPMWTGDESEGHWVCLACNQAGADDGGCKTIQHLPDCEYADALAASTCPHLNTVPETRGGRRLVEGQVDDDIYEVEVCKDCGADLATKQLIDLAAEEDDRPERSTYP